MLLLLIRGTKESAFVNGLIVILKTTIVLLIIGIAIVVSTPFSAAHRSQRCSSVTAPIHFGP